MMKFIQYVFYLKSDYLYKLQTQVYFIVKFDFGN